MMVGCQAGDTKPNLAAMLSRCRNMSGGSTGSLGSLEAELPEFNPLSLSWGSDVISTFRSGFALPNVRTSPQSVSSDTSTSDANSSSGQKNVVNPTRYKTETCRPFTETGYCKYGEKCQFAHGPQEQRAMPRHPKYKTELCRTFHTVGFCPYGPRCHFIHNEDESKLGEINQMKQQYAQQQAVQELASQTARFQALISQSALDSQLQALIGQGHPSLMCNTQYVAQIPVQGMMAQPMGAEQFQQWMSVPPPPLMRSDTLGSTGDTPPSSESSSPVTTPTLQWREPAPEVTHRTPSVPTCGYPRYPSNPTQLSVSAEPTSPVDVPPLVRGLKSLSFRATITEPAILPELFDTPPSSPECGSLSSSGRSMRLPVFSKLAASE